MQQPYELILDEFKKLQKIDAENIARRAKWLGKYHSINMLLTDITVKLSHEGYGLKDQIQVIFDAQPKLWSRLIIQRGDEPALSSVEKGFSIIFAPSFIGKINVSVIGHSYNDSEPDHVHIHTFESADEMSDLNIYEVVQRAVAAAIKTSITVKDIYLF